MEDAKQAQEQSAAKLEMLIKVTAHLEQLREREGKLNHDLLEPGVPETEFAAKRDELRKIKSEFEYIDTHGKIPSDESIASGVETKRMERQQDEMLQQTRQGAEDAHVAYVNTEAQEQVVAAKAAAVRLELTMLVSNESKVTAAAHLKNLTTLEHALEVNASMFKDSAEALAKEASVEAMETPKESQARRKMHILEAQIAQRKANITIVEELVTALKAKESKLQGQIVVLQMAGKESEGRLLEVKTEFAGLMQELETRQAVLAKEGSHLVDDKQQLAQLKSKTRNHMANSPKFLAQQEATSALRAEIGLLRLRIDSGEMPSEERARMQGNVTELQEAVNRIRSHVGAYFDKKILLDDIHRFNEQAQLAESAVQHGEQVLQQLGEEHLAAESIIHRDSNSSETTSMGTTGAAQWAAQVRLDELDQKLNATQEAMLRFSELATDIAGQRTAESAKLTQVEVEDHLATVEEKTEDSLALEMEMQTEALKLSLENESSDDVAEEVANVLAEDKKVITDMLQTGASELRAEEAEIKEKNTAKHREATETLRTELAAIVSKGESSFEAGLARFKEAMNIVSACPAVGELEARFKDSVEKADAATKHVQRLEDDIRKAKEAISNKQSKSLANILLRPESNNNLTNLDVPSEWSFQERWHITRLQRRAQKANKKLVEATKIVQDWQEQQHALSEQLVHHRTAGLNESQAESHQAQIFRGMAAAAEDTGSGWGATTEHLSNLIRNWLERTQWTLDSSKLAAEGACAAALPADESETGPNRNQAWAREMEQEVRFAIQRTFRREVSTAQQRVEEAYFEGRLKTAYKHNEDMQALAPDKTKLNKIIEESTKAAAVLFNKDMIVEQLQELELVRAAKVKLGNADAAQRRLESMEKRLQTMQHYRTAQELLEDGAGPLHTRLIQLQTMLCDATSGTARHVIRGSIRYLDRQLKRIQRKLHWGLKREEQQAFIQGEVQDTSDRAKRAQLVIAVSHAAEPTLQNLKSKLTNRTREIGPFLSASVLGSQLERLQQTITTTQAFKARGEARFHLLSTEATDAKSLMKTLDANERSIAQALEPLKAQHDALQEQAQKGKTKSERVRARERIREIQDDIDKTERRVRSAISVQTSLEGLAVLPNEIHHT